MHGLFNFSLIPTAALYNRSNGSYILTMCTCVYVQRGSSMDNKSNMLSYQLYILSSETYRQTFNIRNTKYQSVNVSRLVLQLSLPIHWSQLLSWKEDIVGAAPTGDTPTTSEWSTILLPTKVLHILEFWLYIAILIFFQAYLLFNWFP